MSRWPHSPLRRAFDLLAASLMLVVTGPLMVIAAIAVAIESPGHPIFRQRRVGRGGVPFEVYKLRTMVVGAEQMGAGLAVDENDKRITRVGDLLRRTSMDTRDIAESLGFGDEHHLARQFRRVTGRTTREFRRDAG